MIKDLVVATHNAHKLEEIRSILSPLSIRVLSATEVGLTEIPETGNTFEENALLKARFAFSQTGKPSLADDSGLCITALNGAPGLRSARFAQEHGGYPSVFEEIRRQMGDNPDKSACFICCMALVVAPNESFVFTGKMTGKIAEKASGTHLFGYDPIFIPDGYTKTCGALEPDIKNQISHRAKALSQLTAFLTRKD